MCSLFIRNINLLFVENNILKSTLLALIAFAGSIYFEVKDTKHLLPETSVLNIEKEISISIYFYLELSLNKIFKGVSDLYEIAV